MTPPPDTNLINVDDWSRETWEAILARARRLRSGAAPRRPRKTSGLVLFFAEPSTRTRLSFERAALRLGVVPSQLDTTGSSLAKNESLADTGATLEALGHVLVVLRHTRPGAARDLIASTRGLLHVVSAGEGQTTHPTQAALDLLTIIDHVRSFPEITVALFGDLAHSRVARSTVTLLRRFGVRDIRLAPGPFPLSNDDYPGVTRTTADEAAVGAHVLIALRLQRERWDASPPVFDGYLETHGLTTRRLSMARADAIVLHPGPLNRGIEIADDVADGPRSRILTQVENGVWVRLAILERFLA